MRFSLKTLLYTFVVISLLCAGYSYLRIQQLEEQRIQQLKFLSGVVQCFYHYCETRGTPPASTYPLVNEKNALVGWLPILVNGNIALLGFDPQIAKTEKELLATCDTSFPDGIGCIAGNLNSHVLAVYGPDSFLDQLDFGSEETDVICNPDVIVLLGFSSGRHWALPCHFDVSKDDLASQIEKQFNQPFPVAFADGSVWLLDAAVPPKLLEKYLSTATKSKRGRDNELSRYAIQKIDPVFKESEIAEMKDWYFKKRAEQSSEAN